MYARTLAVTVLAIVLATACTSEPDYQPIAEELVEREAPAAASASATPVEPDEVYVVRAGDTLARIAVAHGTTVSALAAANGIRNVDLIEVGQRLVLPAGATGEAVNAEPEPAAPSDTALTSTQSATTSDVDAPATTAEDPDFLSALPRRVDLEGARGPAYILFGAGALLTAIALLVIVFTAVRVTLLRVARASRTAGAWLVRKSHLAPLSRRLGRRIGGFAARRWAASRATLGRASRRVTSRIRSRLPNVRLPVPSVAGRGGGARQWARQLLAAAGRGARRLGAWLLAVMTRTLRWLGRAGYRGANRTAQRGRETAERAIEQRRAQRRAQERAAELERLAALGVAELRLGMVEQAEREIRAEMEALAPASTVERGVCLVRLAEVLIREDDHAAATRCLDEGLEAMGAQGPPEAYQQVQTLRLRLRAATSVDAPLAAR